MTDGMQKTQWSLLTGVFWMVESYEFKWLGMVVLTPHTGVAVHEDLDPDLVVVDPVQVLVTGTVIVGENRNRNPAPAQEHVGNGLLLEDARVAHAQDKNPEKETVSLLPQEGIQGVDLRERKDLLDAMQHVRGHDRGPDPVHRPAPGPVLTKSVLRAGEGHNLPLSSSFIHSRNYLKTFLHKLPRFLTIIC